MPREVETPADIAQEWLDLMSRSVPGAVNDLPSLQELEARIIKAVRIQDIVQSRGPLQPGQIVNPQLKCPHCHVVLGRYAWFSPGDAPNLRIYYCEMCLSVLGMETVG